MNMTKVHSGAVICGLALSFFLVGCEADPNDEDQDLPTETQRRVLHEVFSGSNCGPCLEADERLLDVLHANEGAYVLLSYQIGSDPYVTTEGVQRRMSYLPSDAESYSIPWVQADGDNGFHPNEINNDEGYHQDNFDEFVAEPCSLELTVTYEVVDQTIDLEVTLTPLQDEPSEDLALYVAIIEGTTFENVGSNGQTEFHHVMKKMLPDQHGHSLDPLVRGEVVTVSDSYTFQGDYDDDTSISNAVDHDEAHTVEEFDDLSVVVFVQDEESRQVHQSAWSGQ